MLVSRVACIAKLQHKPIGYSGPLSRQLLCYRSLVSEVRTSLRNLIEVVLASLLLSGEVSRDRKDWVELAVKYVSVVYPSWSQFQDSTNPVPGSPSLMIMTVVLVSLCVPIWMIFLCKQTPPPPKLGRRLSLRARNGSSIAKASPEIWIWLSSCGMR